MESDLPPAALMSAFKQAALSVTTLYKSANAEIENSQKQGYQDCLDDLLSLLSSDRIHRNSEVAKVREWALSKRRRSNRGYQRSSSRHSRGDESERGYRSRTAGSRSPIIHSDQIHSTPMINHRMASVPPSSSPSAGTTPTPPSPQHNYRHQHPVEHNGQFNFNHNHRMPRHPPPPLAMPLSASEDIELHDPDSDFPVATPLAEQAPHQFNSTLAQTQHRSQTGAWKRRFPYDFLELAAMAEKEKAYDREYGGNKRGRLS